MKEFVTSVPKYRRIDKGDVKYKLEDMLMFVIFGRLSKCVVRAEILQFGKRYLKTVAVYGHVPGRFAVRGNSSSYV